MNHPQNQGTLTPDEMARQLSAMGYQQHANGTTWIKSPATAAAAKLAANRYDLSTLTVDERAALVTSHAEKRNAIRSIHQQAAAMAAQPEEMSADPDTIARLKTEARLDMLQKDAEQAAAAAECSLLYAVQATSGHVTIADRIAHVHLLALHAEAAALHNKIKLLSLHP